MAHIPRDARRRFLAAGIGALAAPALLLPRRALATSPGARALAFAHTHTRERVSLVYAREGGYLRDALSALDRFLRDHYSGAVGSMDPALYDQLHAVQRLLGAARPFHVISGYRSPATNEALRQRGGGVAKSSLHLQGRAIDVRLPGVPLAEVRDAALELKAGGVGYYAASDFVHLDTGRPRRW
jgi:uncharacterized protein YcbK (DUF882 family)